MLNSIRKVFSTVPKEAVMENPAEAVVQANVPVVDMAADFAALQASFTAQSETFAKLTQDLAAAQSALAVVEQEKVQAVANAKAVKMAARKATVEMNIGTAKADAFLAATEMLDDVAFDAVASALAGSVVAEANTALFKEVGVVGAVVPEHVPEAKSEEMRILEAKYKQAPAN